MQDLEKYVTEFKTHEITNFALSTLRNHRHRGVGIPYCKVGRAIRYKLSDIFRHMDSHKVETEDR